MIGIKAFPRRWSEPVPANPADAAVFWMARRRLGTLSPDKEAQFQAWLAEPAHAAAYAQAEAPVEAMGDLAGTPEILRLRNAALAAAPARPGRAMAWRGAGAALAAGLAVVVVLTARHFAHGDPSPGAVQPAAPTQASAAAADRLKRYATRVGERLNVTLADGSVVELNTASLLEVAYTPRRRDVRLLRGQAMFQVAKNKARPFVVTAGDRQITATGTAFDVRIDGRRVKVVLVEGHVVVAPLERTGLGRFAPALATQELSPGEELTAAPAEQVSVAQADMDRAVGWRRGQLIFRDDTLASAVAEFNRYTTTKMVVDDPKLAGLKISGVFGSARSGNFLAAVTTYYPITTQARSPDTIALVPREGAAVLNR